MNKYDMTKYTVGLHENRCIHTHTHTCHHAWLSMCTCKQMHILRKVLVLHWPHSLEQSPLYHSLHKFDSFIQTGSSNASFQELLCIQLNATTALFTFSSSCIVHIPITCNSVIHFPPLVSIVSSCNGLRASLMGVRVHSKFSLLLLIYCYTSSWRTHINKIWQLSCICLIPWTVYKTTTTATTTKSLKNGKGKDTVTYSLPPYPFQWSSSNNMTDSNQFTGTFQLRHRVFPLGLNSQIPVATLWLLSVSELSPLALVATLWPANSFKT